MLHVGLNFSIGESATDETLSIEYGVVRIHGDLILCCIADETFGIGESDV